MDVINYDLEGIIFILICIAILILLTLLSVIILGIILAIFFLFLLPYICYKKTFYSKNSDKDPTILPKDDIYVKHKDIILKDISDARKLNPIDLEIESFDGLKLHAKYYEYDKDSPIEIMFHGYRGNAERDLSTGVKRAALCKRSVVLVDQRASGNSEGHVISFGINERFDCAMWAKYVCKKFGEHRKIILTGISMGAATVLMASNLELPKNVIGILADCPYNKPKDIIIKVVKDMHLSPKVFYPFIKLGAKLYGHFDLEASSPVESVKETSIPVILIHGTSDDYVPCHMSEKLYDSCVSKKKLVTIEEGEHGTSYLKDPDKYIKELEEFVSSL